MRLCTNFSAHRTYRSQKSLSPYYCSSSKSKTGHGETCVKFSSHQSVRYFSFHRRIIQKNVKKSVKEDLEEEFEHTDEISDNSGELVSILDNDYFLPGSGHRILILQPVIRWGPHKNELTNADHQAAEAEALVKTLPNWTVTEILERTLKRPHKTRLFGKGQFQELTSHIRSHGKITAVFVNTQMLSGLQLVTLQHAWKLPIYDRYTMVLQIFKVHAISNEAKLQVALAEIPYFKSRLLGMHYGLLEQSSLEQIGGSADKGIEARRNMLVEREMKIKKTLSKLKGHRMLLRQNRLKKEFPVIAVCGYTNSGKTSLIQTLTGDRDLQPRDQLFATLDVTAHSGNLPSRIKVIYMDTVGFISDIPTDLIEAFTATLEDALLADVIVHVSDMSHPDHEAQVAEVKKTLHSFTMTKGTIPKIIEVWNKCDKVESSELKDTDDDVLMISCKNGSGVNKFLQHLESVVFEVTGLQRKKLKVPASGGHLGWFYKNATVQEVKSSDDGSALLVECIISETNLLKFRALFGRNKNKRS